MGCKVLWIIPQAKQNKLRQHLKCHKAQSWNRKINHISTMKTADVLQLWLKQLKELVLSPGGRHSNILRPCRTENVRSLQLRVAVDHNTWGISEEYKTLNVQWRIIAPKYSRFYAWGEGIDVIIEFEKQCYFRVVLDQLQTGNGLALERDKVAVQQ